MLSICVFSGLCEYFLWKKKIHKDMNSHNVPVVFAFLFLDFCDGYLCHVRENTILKNISSSDLFRPLDITLNQINNLSCKKIIKKLFQAGPISAQTWIHIISEYLLKSEFILSMAVILFDVAHLRSYFLSAKKKNQFLASQGKISGEWKWLKYP